MNLKLVMNDGRKDDAFGSSGTASKNDQRMIGRAE